MRIHHLYVEAIKVKRLNLIRTQLTLTIKKDLKLTQDDISNSNIIALVATYAILLSITLSCH